MKDKNNVIKIEDLEDFPGEFVAGFVKAALEDKEEDMARLGEIVYNQIFSCYGIEIAGD